MCVAAWGGASSFEVDSRNVHKIEFFPTPNQFFSLKEIESGEMVRKGGHVAFAMVVCNVNGIAVGGVVFYVNVIYFAVDGFITSAHVVGMIFA